MKTLFKAICVALAIQAVPASAADFGIIDQSTIADNDKFTIGMFTGVLHTTSKELVYYPDGQRLSQLDWKTKVAPIIGGNFNVRLNERLSWRFEGWTRLLSGSSEMHDTDWRARDIGYPYWTDRSVHPDTSLNRAYGFDTRVGYRFATYDSFSLEALAGYRFKKLRWEASNGSFVYSSFDSPAPGYVSLRDLTGRFRGLGIRYTQWWQTPYLGISGKFDIKRVTLTAELVASPWASGRAHDTHLFRDYDSHDSGSRTKMVGFSLKADYPIEQNWVVFARFDYEAYDVVKGKTRGFEKEEYIVGDAGLSNRSKVLDIGAEYRF